MSTGKYYSEEEIQILKDLWIDQNPFLPPTREEARIIVQEGKLDREPKQIREKILKMQRPIRKEASSYGKEVPPLPRKTSQKEKEPRDVMEVINLYHNKMKVLSEKLLMEVCRGKDMVILILEKEIKALKSRQDVLSSVLAERTKELADLCELRKAVEKIQERKDTHRVKESVLVKDGD